MYVEEFDMEMVVYVVEHICNITLKNQTPFKNKDEMKTCLMSFFVMQY